MRNGFTLIELLLVVVIIGILAALALPKFADIKARAYKASMQSDLRNLATNEVLYDADNGVYAGDTTTLGFQPSKGNTITIDIATPGQFSASAANAAVTGTCSITYGGASGSNAVVCP